jgi:16S rRNA (guanine527-N7)-methyltransferase
VLLDASEQRTDFLAEAVEQLSIGDRVEVVRGRAEAVGREERWAGDFDLVVARSFGPPAVVAECATRFLAVGGRLMVSEPPNAGGEAGARWNHPTELAELSFSLPDASAGEHFAVLVKVSPTGDRYPRRVGIPTKRPLF